MSKFLITEEEKSKILEMYRNATSRQYLNEDSNSNVPQVTFYLPQIKDQNGKLIDNKKGYAKYVVTAAKTPGGAGFTTDEYSKVNNFSFNGTAVKVSSSVKDTTNGNINGQFQLDDTSYSFLVGYVNKGMQNGVTKILTNVLLTAGGSELKNTSFQVVYFTPQQPAQPK